MRVLFCEKRETPRVDTGCLTGKAAGRAQPPTGHFLAYEYASADKRPILNNYQNLADCCLILGTPRCLRCLMAIWNCPRAAIPSKVSRLQWLPLRQCHTGFSITYHHQ
jgi:hypothetical protein